MTFAQETFRRWEGHNCCVCLANGDEIYGMLTGCGADYLQLKRTVANAEYTEIINAAHVVRVVPGMKIGE